LVMAEAAFTAARSLSVSLWTLIGDDMGRQAQPPVQAGRWADDTKATSGTQLVNYFRAHVSLASVACGLITIRNMSRIGCLGL
jgi:hypothetical protein